MAFIKHHFDFAGDTAGTSHRLTYYVVGPEEAETQIFLQAGLHADEQPGMLILHHLLDKLETADAAGALRARFVVFPVVNPLGLTHLQFHRHQGRYHPSIGLNYNRGWPNLAEILLASAPDLAQHLTGSRTENMRYVRSKLAELLDTQTAVTALDRLRHFIMQQALWSDMVLDLHCDDMATNHIYLVPQLWPDVADLARWMGSQATLTAEDSGGGSFDEVWPGLWRQLAASCPDADLPDHLLAATLEYRGQADVSDALNAQDAENLMGFFIGRGLIAMPSPPLPPSVPEATPLNATEIIRVNQPGLIAYHCALGQHVEAGAHIADLIDMDGAQMMRRRTAIYAATSGIIFSLNSSKYVWPGTSIAKIAGAEALASRGDYLLED